MMCFRPDKRYVPFLSFSEMVYGPDQVLRQGYLTLLQSTGWLFQNSSMDISLSNFKDGHALFGFDITPDESSGNNSLTHSLTHSLSTSRRRASGIRN